ncbi:MAG: hypothetical protein Q7W02_02445 [Candidatus Rokubacteria bacterium]|nr:hypothetical protein [Candidatus Rokubacteria bacterium]
MTFDEYVAEMNDPRRPLGLCGPRTAAQVYRISADRRPASALPPAPRALSDSPAAFRQQLALAARRAVPGSPEEFRQQLAASAARGRRAPQQPLVARPPLPRTVTCLRCLGAGFRESAGRYRCQGCRAWLDQRGAVVL